MVSDLCCHFVLFILRLLKAPEQTRTGDPMMIPKMTVSAPGKAARRPQTPYPPSRAPYTRRDHDNRHDNRHGHCDRHGGLTGEFAALGSLFTAGYLFLLIL